MKKIRCALSLIVVSVFSTVTSAQNWDINTLKNINPQNPNSFVMRGLTSSSYPIGAIVPATQLITGYATKNLHLQHQAWETVGSLAVSVVMAESFKRIFNRPRPYEKYPGEIHPYDATETGQSFPSGHTTIAFATATSLSLEYRKWYVVVPAYAWAVGVGYSRLYLGEHYPTDVLGAAVIGTGSALLSHWLTKKIFKHY
ncbi:MAG TPA: phosphatase PAP2 family protein [Chitinophagaceae bacterium]|nr:phosphatase PAP2 family protein [Chitinophagaceae bacterium]